MQTTLYFPDSYNIPSKLLQHLIMSILFWAYKSVRDMYTWKSLIKAMRSLVGQLYLHRMRGLILAREKETETIFKFDCVSKNEEGLVRGRKTCFPHMIRETDCFPHMIRETDRFPFLLPMHGPHAYLIKHNE